MCLSTSRILVLGSSLCVLALCAPVPPAFAWAVYNDTDTHIRVRIHSISGSTSCGAWDSEGKLIAPGDSAGPNWREEDCNPTERRDSSLVMQAWQPIDTDDMTSGGSASDARCDFDPEITLATGTLCPGNRGSGTGAFQCFVEMRGGGFLVVQPQNRPDFAGPGHDIVPNVHCLSAFDVVHGDFSTRTLIDSSDAYATQDPFVTGTSGCCLQAPPMTPANRRVGFLVTGDPQYWHDKFSSESYTGDANRVLGTAMDLLATSSRRGLIVTGDLTQSAAPGSLIYPASELDRYVGAITGLQRFVFEGLGNHDIEDINVRSDPEALRSYVALKARNTVRTGFAYPHYSWDWHDVHFVQLNLFPGDTASADFPHLSPRGALRFLNNDLRDNVGSSGRPVVLAHHYGFDCLSIGRPCRDEDSWWTEEERKAYWNAIKDVNVVAIFTGHQHLTDSTARGDFQTDFSQPAASDNRPDGRTFLPAFNAAAARGSGARANDGVFLDVVIDSCNQMHIARKNENGQGIETETVNFSTDTWGGTGPTCRATASCRPDFTVTADASCQATTSIEDTGSSGSCNESTTGPLGLGDHPVTLTCSAPLGSDSCTTTVTVADHASPVISTCARPAGQVECGTELSYPEPTADDNCSDVTFSCTPVNGTVSALVTTEVRCTASDASGNTATCNSPVQVVDTISPTGRITGPAAGSCHGPLAIPVTVTDNMQDSCVANLARTYAPGPGPAYRDHGDYSVQLSAADSSGNSVGDSVAFTVDLIPPAASLAGGFATFPAAVTMQASDIDGATGGVLHERFYFDDCLVYDGATHGDGDGFLSDETITIGMSELCTVVNRCGASVLDRPTLRFEADDCGGNTGVATVQIGKRLFLRPGSCGPTTRRIGAPDQRDTEVTEGGTGTRFGGK